MYLLYLNPLIPKTATYFFLVIVLYSVCVWDLTDYLNNFQTKSILSLCRYLCFTPLTILRWVSSSWKEIENPSPQGAGVETLSGWTATISVGSLMKFFKPGLRSDFCGEHKKFWEMKLISFKSPPQKDVTRLSKSNSDCKHLLHDYSGAVLGGCLNRPIVHCVEMKPNWFGIDVLPCCKLLHGSTNPKLSKAANSCWTGYGCWGAQFCFWSMPELQGGFSVVLFTVKWGRKSINHVVTAREMRSIISLDIGYRGSKDLMECSQTHRKMMPANCCTQNC